MARASALPATGYCLRCSRPAPIDTGALDPRYVMVRCWHDRDPIPGEQASISIGTLDQQEAWLVVKERRRERVTARHAEHVRHRKASPDCDICAVEPPEKHARPHDYEPIAKKLRIIAHLDFDHGDKSLVSSLHQRTHMEADDLHRELHRRMEAASDA